MASSSRLSPSSSPRLPSPPPMAEDQISSPQTGLSDNRRGNRASQNLDEGASRRIRPGTRAADMSDGPPLMDLADIDSAFQLTEHLKALHNYYTHPEDSPLTVPVDHEMALRLAQAPDGIDRALWLYELCRFLVQKVNTIVIALFADQPPCSSQTCPEMRASEWQYLCAVHEPPKSCCAIDYCCHTLDWAANTLSSPKHFPSRLALGTEATNVQHQVRHLTNIFRRVYRIFAHAWFQHRDIFWRVEATAGLYMFFKTVCDAYSLIPDDNYTIPPEAEGLGPTDKSGGSPRSQSTVVESDKQNISQHSTTPSALPTHGAPGSTTRRHRQMPSSGAHSVSSVIEEHEEEEEEEQHGEELVSDSKSEDIVTQMGHQREELAVGNESTAVVSTAVSGARVDTNENAGTVVAVDDDEVQPPFGGLQRADTVRRDNGRDGSLLEDAKQAETTILDADADTENIED